MKIPTWFKNAFRLGVKELYSLSRDRALMVLMLWVFTGGVFTAAKGAGEASINNAPIAIVDEDHSPLSQRIADAFLPPYFRSQQTSYAAADRLLDEGRVTFVLVLPSRLENDIIGGHTPNLQLLIDATQMRQAGIGANFISTIINEQVREFLKQTRAAPAMPAEVVVRAKYNPNLIPTGFQGVVQLINNITMLTVILVGAAVIREREHGTIEHALAMPVTPFEIMLAKVWATTLVMMIVITASLFFIFQQALHVKIAGSFVLLMFGVLIYLFSVTSIGIFVATIARSMPQLGLLAIMVVNPMNLLSGSNTPIESEPVFLQVIMQFVPSTHFVAFAQGVIFRGELIGETWSRLILMAVFGLVLFLGALMRFRRTMSA